MPATHLNVFVHVMFGAQNSVLYEEIPFSVFCYISCLFMSTGWGIAWTVYHGQCAFEQMVNTLTPANKSRDVTRIHLAQSRNSKLRIFLGLSQVKCVSERIIPSIFYCSLPQRTFLSALTVSRKSHTGTSPYDK